MKMYGLEGFEHLKEEKYVPQPVPEFMEEGSVFDKIRQGDILLHHPFQTFAPVVQFIREARPGIRRCWPSSRHCTASAAIRPIIAALAQAAENGKQVSVLVELKARFDEENNIVLG